ncbi:hypothetical protein ABZX77_02885 [Streptomyces sp. NPDC004237]
MTLGTGFGEAVRCHVTATSWKLAQAISAVSKMEIAARRIM